MNTGTVMRDETLTLPQAASILGCSQQLLREAIRKLPAKPPKKVKHVLKTFPMVAIPRDWLGQLRMILDTPGKAWRTEFKKRVKPTLL